MKCLYGKLIKKIDNYEKKIERYIANEILHFEERSREEDMRYAQVTTEHLYSIASSRFEECLCKIHSKSEEQKEKSHGEI